MINSVAGINTVNIFDNFLTIGGFGRHFKFADDGCYEDGKIDCFFML